MRRLFLFFALFGGSALSAFAQAPATPTFSPVAGSYTGTQSVTISDATSGVALYYTLDGSTPTTASTSYTGPVSVAATATLKAVATLSFVTITPANQTINAGDQQQYTATDPIGADITGSVTWGSSNTGVATIDGGGNATGVAGGLTNITANSSEAPTYSTVGSAAYTITSDGHAAMPLMSPVAGTYFSPQSVTITDSTPSSTIYYTTDGSTPTTMSSVYSTPISVTVTTTIKAMATASGFTQSFVVGNTYTIAAAGTIQGRRAHFGWLPF